LKKQRPEDLDVEIGKPEGPTFVAKAQSLVVQPEKRQDRRVQVMNMDGVLDDPDLPSGRC
jgi:hypothetical protein